MRILFLNPTGTLGGAERCLMDMAASLRAGVENVEIGLVVGSDGPLLHRAKALGIRVMLLPLGRRIGRVGDSGLINRGVAARARWGVRAIPASLEAAAYVARLNAAIRRFGPSIVHSNGIKMHLLAAIARSSAPLVWHIHDFVGERPLVSHALALFAHRADAAIAISNAVAIDARRTLPRLPSAVVHNAVDTAAFSPDGPRADLDALGGREAPPVGTVRVGLVATYARWKGHDIFLKAAGLARRHVPNVRFYIIGGPIYATGASQFSREELQRLAYDLEVDRCVLFVPFQNEIEDAYRALDIVVHASSRPEPFGRTIAEGMASGRAVVASREGGAGEIFADGIDGVGVAPRDEAALAQTIIALAADPPRRQAIAAAARLRAVEHFSRARLAGQLLRVYSSAGVR